MGRSAKFAKRSTHKEKDLKKTIHGRTAAPPASAGRGVTKKGSGGVPDDLAAVMKREFLEATAGRLGSNGGDVAMQSADPTTNTEVKPKLSGANRLKQRAKKAQLKNSDAGSTGPRKDYVDLFTGRQKGKLRDSLL
ncbi:hypothetical protein IWQ60_004245 [Tieghemiomyces parasiticus]|uniref:Uncharacterized protein n=1 Tax=Tieghemiomyces parasiticus TaxID=78921 RepID=A0A9W8DZY9_9FUNG|nr:hypothetical protein IWQ60_004245 [Tieghemiomyces parasiticus]